MADKNLVTQDELKATIAGLNALADNLNEHVNQSLSKAHGWSILDAPYLDSGGIYQTDFGQSGFSTIPGIANTGVNSDGTLASPGSVDQHWTLILSPDPAAPGPSAFVASPLKSKWSSNGPISQWISPAADATKNRKGGSYKYRISFNLSGFNPASAVVRGNWVSDDKTTSVLLNGIVTGVTGPSNFTKQPAAGGSSFYFNAGFVAGVNTLDFIVNNGSGSPTGIRVEITGTASTGGVFIVSSVYGTGLNNDRTLATRGIADLHWTLIQSASGLNPGPTAYVLNAPLDGSWQGNTTTSQWIGVLPGGTQSPGVGTYVYRTTFDLTGFNPQSIILKGQFNVDDSVTQCVLNGIPINFPIGNKKTISTFILSSGFVSGVNTLDIHVKNTVTHTGLRVDMSATGSKGGTGLPSRVLRLTIGGNVFYIPCQASGGVDGTLDPAIPSFTGIISPQSADPASDLTVGSPTPSKLITTFAEQLIAIANAASDTLLQHAGSQPEEAHGGLSWQNDTVTNTAGNTVGRRTVNILLNGVQYKIVGDFSLNGPLP